MTDSAPQLHPISYETFLADMEAIAAQIEAGDWKPDFLVGVGRGGLVPAAYLSHRTGIKLLSVDHSAGDVAFADELLKKLALKSREGSRILIVDDINDSGHTIDYLRRFLISHGCVEPHVRVAVLLNNIRSKATAEYAGTMIDRAEDKRWFVFPWEAVAKAETIVEDAGAMPERLA